jgi:hypothetical protein
MNTDNTRDAAEPPPASAGSHSEPVGWQATDEFGRPAGFLSWKDDETRWPKNESVPLYLQPKPALADAEREAVERSERWARLEGYDSDAATLRGLLARLLLTDDERDAVGMSDKPCGTCGLMVVGTNGVAMTDAKKWLTAPLPCPECSDDAGTQFRELGRQYAKKIDDAIWKALEASDE